MTQLEEIRGVRHPLPGLSRTVDLVVSLVRSSREDNGLGANPQAASDLLDLFKSDLDQSKAEAARRPAPSEETQRADLERIRDALYSPVTS